jgi:hypothetical protein
MNIGIIIRKSDGVMVMVILTLVTMKMEIKAMRTMKKMKMIIK